MSKRRNRQNVRPCAITFGSAGLLLWVGVTVALGAEPWYSEFETEAGLALSGQQLLSSLQGRIDNTGTDGPLLVPAVNGTAIDAALPLSDGTALYTSAETGGTAENVNTVVTYVAYSAASVPDMPLQLDPGGLAGSHAVYNPDQILFQINTNVPSNAAPDACTMEGYFCPIEATAVRQVLAIQARDHRYYAGRLMVYLLNGKLYVMVGNNVAFVEGAAPALNKWHHFAVTQSTDGTVNLYLDGALAGSASSTVVSGTANFTLAGDAYSAHKWGFKGYVDAFRIYRRALDPSELLTSGGTSATDLIWQTDFETEAGATVSHGQVLSTAARAIDNEAASVIPSIAEPTYAGYTDPSVPAIPGTIDPSSLAGSFALQNSEQDQFFYIDTGTPSNVAPSITMEGFFYMSAASDTTYKKYLVLQARDDRLIAGRAQAHVQHDANLGHDTLHAQIGWPAAYIDGSTEVTREAWHHFALTYDGNEAALYLDGQLEGNVIHSVPAGTGNLSVGGRGVGDSYESWIGYMDEVRVYRRILSPSEFLINGGTGPEDLVWHSRFETQGDTAVSHGKKVSLTAKAIDNLAPRKLPVAYQALADSGVPDVPGEINPQGVTGSFAIHNTELQDFRIDTNVPASAAPGDVTLEGYLALGSTAIPEGDYVLVVQPSDAATGIRASIGVIRDATGVKLKGRGFGPAPLDATGTTLLSAGRWYHFALVVDQHAGDPGTHDLRVYLDGVLQAEATGGLLAAPVADAADFHVGNIAGPSTTGVTGSAFRPGWLDAVRITADALSPAAFLMNAGAASPGIWYSSFETELGVSVGHDQAVSVNPLAIDNLAPPTVTAYSGTAAEVNDAAMYMPYSAATVPDVPPSVDPARVTGQFAVQNPDVGNQGSFRVSTRLPSDWGNLANGITMEGFFNLQEDMGVLDPSQHNLVIRRFLMQKRANGSWTLKRVIIGLAHDASNSRTVLGVTYYTTGDALYHHVLGTTPINIGDWHHFAVTVERDSLASTDDLRFYLDGIEEGAVLDLADLSPPGADVVTIGDAEGLSFKGFFDAFRVTDLAMQPSSFLNTGSAPLSPDFNFDGIVDGADFTFFASCVTGPELGPPATTPKDCTPTDLDLDSDVDMDDFGRFQRCIGETGTPVDASCLQR